MVRIFAPYAWTGLRLLFAVDTLDEYEKQCRSPAENDHPVRSLDGRQRPPVPGEDDIAITQGCKCHHGEVEGGFQIRQRCDQRVKKIEQGPKPGLEDDGQKHPDGQRRKQDRLYRLLSDITEAGSPPFCRFRPTHHK